MDLPVDAFFRNLEEQGGYSEHTFQAYVTDIEKFVQHLSNDHHRHPQVSDFTARSISRFISSEKKAGKRNSTLYRRRASLRRLAKYLRSQELIENDPTKDKRVLRRVSSSRKKKFRNIRILDQKEIIRVAELMQQTNTARALRDHTMFSLLLETGAPIRTVVGFDLPDLDLVGKRLRIKQLGFQESYRLKISKSAELLSLYLREGRPNLTQIRLEQALFVSQMGRRITRQAVWQALINWGKRAKLKKELSPRQIRYAAVADMCSQGYTVVEMQRSLGHRNPQSTRALLRRLNLKRTKG